MPISGDNEGNERIWYTYHANALETTREAISYDSTIQSRPIETDRNLVCIIKSKQKKFKKSLNSIVLNVFLLEYRINRVIEYLNISINNRVPSYYDKNEVLKNVSKKIEDLSLYEKWRNIPSIAGVRVTNRYINTIKKLDKWIQMRNKIAHADYIRINNFDISPRKARRCFNDVTKAIFELNVALGYDKRKHAEESCKKMLL